MARVTDPLAAQTPGAADQTSVPGDWNEQRLLPAHSTDSERFFEDLRTFVADAGALLQQARTLSGDAAIAARDAFERRIAQGRQGLYGARARVADKAHDLRDRTERRVREDPWTAIGIAAAAGILIGIFMRRGR